MAVSFRRTQGQLSDVGNPKMWQLVQEVGRRRFDNGAGICVLSHTNVAVNEIKEKMSDYAGKLMSYPNYVGTIQSFIDRFVTMPYLKRKFGKSVQPVDNRTYAEHLCSIIHS